MNIFILLLNCLTFSIGNSLLLYILIKKVLDNKIKYLHIFFVILASCIVVPISENLLLISAFFCSLLLVFIYSNNMLLSILISIISQISFFIVTMIPSIFAIFVISNLDHSRNTWWYNVLFSLAYLLLTLILCKILSVINFNFAIIKNFKFQINEAYNIAIINIVLFFIAICLLPIFYRLDFPTWKTQSIVHTFLTIIFIINCLVSFLIYKSILKTKIKAAEKDIEIKLTKEYKESIEKLYDDIMDFKHDYIKIYSTMQIFISDKNMEGLSDYFSKNIVPMSKEFTNKNLYVKSLVLIQDISLQSTLYTALITANAKKTPLLIEVNEKIPESIINPIDLSRVIGIFIQNAFEACENLSNPDIHITILRINNGSLFVIKNNYSNTINLNEIFNKGVTSKKGTHQGRGLSIAKNIIGSYPNATLNIRTNEDNFICELYVMDT